MSATFDRQIRPIYDAIDTGSNKSAIVACNKLLKKQPKNDLVKALKALALVRSQKVEESLYLCDEVLASKPSDEATLSALSHVLRGLGRHLDIITMYDSAWKQQPSNEDLGAQTFSANARTGNWKSAQQVATKMHKLFKEERYLYWSIFCAVLQANDQTTQPALRPVLYKLAHRLISSAQTPSFFSADRFYVHLTILKELELWDDATALLSSEIGQSICNTNLTIDELRREIWRAKGDVKEEGERAQQRIREKDDRNWLEFLSVLDATFSDVTSTAEPSDEDKQACRHHVSKTKEFLAQIADKDGTQDRSGPLALLELEKRCVAHGLATDPDAIYTLAESYFERFGDKACCFEDLVPYIQFSGQHATRWTSLLEKQTSVANPEALRRAINALKLLRYNLTQELLTPELENARATQYVQYYLQGLAHGKNLPDTELQPSDDLAVLAGHAYTNLWKLTGDLSYLHRAVAILELASSKSKHSYVVRIMLIRIYHILGAPSLALEHYRLLNVKQVQTDTLSYLILSRASTFSLSSLGDLTYSSECMEASQIYLSNSTDTAEFVVRAFYAEKYSQIPDFVTLEDRLDNSLQRDLMKMEHVRMRLAHEPISSDLVDMELIELKFIFDRIHHDNRDFTVIPNHQPRDVPSFQEQTALFGKIPGSGWLASFLRFYIKAFQQASDLDDSVEDKLLIGDRPKPHVESAGNMSLDDRLAQRPKAELEELTRDEQALLEFSTALSEWLGPHHDYIRPPPSAVLAEAARQTELKLGHQPKGLTLPENGANGDVKKDCDPPVVQDPPEIALQFFDDMKERFTTALSGSVLLPELLHIVTLTQEASLIFTVETTRFKPAAVVKTHKLGPLVQSFKEIRTKASEALELMSTELAKLAKAEKDADRRTEFVGHWTKFEDSEITTEFLAGVAKKFTDARYQILDGVSKGAAKVSKTLTS
ncbi:N-acetyltransferase B complex non catalytic subunit-domain-containing protein [Phanerochaete sordida]|uniref:N-acetyltransferase B complex non catalytic subunit-domain-containing protein n=1 Tax=Phanerochaete sordida TaxID=48140 RepID=A0A9P3G2M5_9APHY|nr:N-acetyltransferase B complex non catalytic subunit-domain-containing protein [Phanerochaete sordida]